MFRISTRPAIVSFSVAALLLVAGIASERPAAQAPPAGVVTALTGARIIDGTGRPALEAATILMRNGRIEAVGSAVTVPAGATRVDMSGKTIMPGIVNAHGHAQKGLDAKIPIREDLIRQLRMYAAYGVTTVVSLGANPDDELEQIKLRDEQNSIVLDRARLYTSGASVRRFKTPDEARKDTNRVADLKPDIIKFHFDDPPANMSAETWGAIVEEARKRGLRTAPHVFYLRDAKAAVEKGADALAHSVRDMDVDAGLIAEMKRRDVGVIPTLTREVTVYAYETTPAFFSDPFFQRGMSLYKEHVNIVTAPAFQEKVRNDKVAQSIKQAFVQAKRNLKIMSDAGIPIGLGTDSGVPNNTTFGRFQGYLEHMELELMVESGLTPMQALTAGTSGSARIIRLDNVGTIAPGKAADLLVLDANPLQDIRNTKRLNSVWIAGRRLAAMGTN
jgi:imidazolonepropionase-like amidohydrolase